MKGYTKVLRTAWDGKRIRAIRDTATLRRKEHQAHYWQMVVELADHYWFPGLLVSEPFQPHEVRHLCYRLDCTHGQLDETLEELARVNLIKRVSDSEGQAYIYAVDWAKQQDKYRGGGKLYTERYASTMIIMENSARQRYSELMRACGLVPRALKCRKHNALGEDEKRSVNGPGPSKTASLGASQVPTEAKPRNDANLGEVAHPKTTRELEINPASPPFLPRARAKETAHVALKSKEEAKHTNPPTGPPHGGPVASSTATGRPSQFPEIIEIELKEWKFYDLRWRFNASQWAKKMMNAGRRPAAIARVLREMRVPAIAETIENPIAWGTDRLYRVEVLQRHDELKKEEKGFVTAGSVLKGLIGNTGGQDA